MPDPAGALVADHTGADGRPRGTALPVEAAVGGPGDPAEDPVADACRVLLDVPDGEAIPLQGIEGLELLLQPEAGSGDDRKSSPLRVACLEDPVHHLLRLRVPLPADRPRVRVLHPVLTRPDLLQEHEEPEEDILREEARDDLGHGESLVVGETAHRADMAGEDEAVELRLTLGEEPSHGGGHQPVEGEDGEVLRGAREDRRGHRGRRRLEPDGDEDHVLFALPGDLHGPVDPLDHPDVAPGGFEGAPGPRDPEEVPVRGEGDTLSGELQGAVDLPLGGNADRAPGSHDDLQAGREEAPQAGTGDGSLVGSADVHERVVPVREVADRP